MSYIGNNFSFNTFDNDFRNVLFNSDGSLGRLVIDTHQLAIGLLLILAAPEVSIALSLVYLGAGIWTIKNSVSKYDESLVGTVGAAVHFGATFLTSRVGGVWNLVFGN